MLKFRIGVLVSGGGSNLQAIIDRIEDGFLGDCQIVSVVASRSDAYALKRAEDHNIPSKVIRPKDYSDPKEYDRELTEYFTDLKPDLIVLAGFLTILGEGFVNAFKGKMINIHPALIPSFCGKGYYGLKPHQAALEYGVKVTGATVHFVDPEVDAGPIILQKAVYVEEGDTPEILQKRVMEQAEWIILPQAVRMLADRFFEKINREDCGLQ